MLRTFFTGVLFFAVALTQGQDYGQKIDSLNATIPALSSKSLEDTFSKLNGYLSQVPEKVAFTKAEQSLTEAYANREPFAVYLAMWNLSNLYARYQQQAKALQHLQEGLLYVRERSDSLSIALAYYYNADFYRKQQLQSTALENILHASTIFQSLKNYSYVASCHYMASSILYNARNFIQAIDECQLALQNFQLIPELDKTSDNEFMAMSSYNTMGLCYYKIRQYDKSLVNYDLAERYAKKLNNEFWVGLVNGNRAVVYKDLNLLDEAVNSMLLDFRISKKYNEYESAARAAIAMAEIFMIRNDSKLAETYLDSAHQLLSIRKRFEQSDYWKVEAMLRKVRGDLAGAYEAQVRYNQLRDSMSREAESANLTKVKANYELEHKQREIEQLAENNQRNRERIRLQNAIIITSTTILLLLLVLAVSYIRNFRKQRKINKLIQRQRDEIEYKNEELEAQSQQLQQANNLARTLNSQLEQKVHERTEKLEVALNELDTFLYRSSHDMRRPLSTLLGLENIAKLETTDKNVLSLFEMVAETARQMDGMLLKLQMTYELDRADGEWRNVKLDELLKDLAAKIQKRLPAGNATIEVDAHTASLHSNPQLLTIIFTNILENAINFRQPKLNGKVEINIHVFDSKQQIQVVISDNGMGIDQDYLPKIFEQYFKGTEISKGNGLGLFLVKKAIEKLKGKIEVKSELDMGTTFIITLPHLSTG